MDGTLKPALRTAAAAVGLTVMMLLIVSCSADSTPESSARARVVNIYNWSDYIAPDTIRNFEREFGIKVNYDIYDSSEVVDAKLLAGSSGYDVVFHANQFAARLAPLGIFQKLDYSKFSNLRHLDPEILAKTSLYAVLEGYSLPYMWGSTGYAYNETMVRRRLPDLEMDSANVLFDPAIISKLADCGVSLLDSPTDVFPMVLSYLGRDPNAVDEESIAAAEAQLELIRPYVRYFSSTKMISDLPNRETCVAMSWSGDYAQASMRAKEAGIDIDLRYTMPKEGSGLWVDAMFVPADARHVENAYLFMDYIMRPAVTAAISNHVFYANVNKSAVPLLNAAVANDPGIYPDEQSWELLYPVLPAEPKEERLRTRAWARVKSGI
jgi:putrescine transport system substrate-binding protein